MRIKLLIVQLGGNKPVSQRCGVTSAAVSAWIAADCIPREHHVAVWDMATEAGVEWTPPGAEELRARLAGAAPTKAEAA